MTDENDRLKKMMDDQTSLPIMPIIMTKEKKIDVAFTYKDNKWVANVDGVEMTKEQFWNKYGKEVKEEQANSSEDEFDKKFKGNTCSRCLKQNYEIYN